MADAQTHHLWRLLVRGQLDHLPGHLVDGPNDLEHLVVGDEAVTVDVVELEGPCAGVSNLTSQRVT
jgi:hypothetical protein